MQNATAMSKMPLFQQKNNFLNQGPLKARLNVTCDILYTADTKLP